MSVTPTFGSPQPTEPEAEQEKVRAVPPQAPAQTFPPSGNDSTREVSTPQKAPAAAARGEDEVKLQWQPPGETAVYQFVNQQGSVILQVPSEQVLDLGREISQELAHEDAAKQTPAVEGGKDNAH
jgi:hypothetical protein